MTPQGLSTAFGLAWSSPDLPLPELPGLHGDAAAGELIEVRRESSGGWPALPAGRHDTPWLQMQPGDLRLEVASIGRFRIAAGERIGFDPWDEDVSDQDLRTFLLGSAVGALLIQRGMLVLHGNALARNGQAIVCLGHSGAGKSTLAFALMRQGWRLLADDLVAVTPAGLVLPGIPRIKLWRDAALAFGLNPATLPPIQQGIEKYLLMGEVVQRAPAPAALRALYLIDALPEDQDSCEAERITRITRQKDAALLLRDQAYRPHFVRGLGREGPNFLALASLQRRVPLATLPLPRGIAAMQNHLEALDLLQAAAQAEGPRSADRQQATLSV